LFICFKLGKIFQILELEQKLKDQQLLNQRRMEEFEKKCKEVLSVFKHLSGFKVTFYEKTVKLQSICVKSKENFLVFKVKFLLKLRKIYTIYIFRSTTMAL
jgi:hypothetical protein